MKLHTVEYLIFAMSEDSALAALSRKFGRDIETTSGEIYLKGKLRRWRLNNENLIRIKNVRGLLKNLIVVEVDTEPNSGKHFIEQILKTRWERGDADILIKNMEIWDDPTSNKYKCKVFGELGD